MANPVVWIVSLEWNQPPSEVVGDTGIVGVFSDEALARKCQLATQREHDEHDNVYEFSKVAGRHCIACGEVDIDANGVKHDCKNIAPEDAEEFCDHCGAELGNHNTCDNDHDEWDIDVHCTEWPVMEVFNG